MGNSVGGWWENETLMGKWNNFKKEQSSFLETLLNILQGAEYD